MVRFSALVEKLLLCILNGKYVGKRGVVGLSMGRVAVLPSTA